jgi:3-dehydroquinate synthase
VKTVRVATEPPYEVRIGRGLLREVAAGTARFTRRAVLSDDIVASLYLDRLKGLDAPSMAVPAGEASKSMATLERVLDFMAEADLDRGSCLVALGGGVVGDLAGLAASLYMRGIAFVQVPTTLLAQVDASVGGKTAVDLAAGKNLAGTFHQPALVLADTDTLATLPEREYRSGLGEVVKSALIDGEEALQVLERGTAAIVARDPEVLAGVVERCVRLKAAIVARDPTEKRERKVLNLGHTFAHAIERSTGYGTIPHGIAVAVGLILALHTSRELGLLADAALPGRVERILRNLGLPHDLAAFQNAHPAKLGAAEMLAGARHDKKGTSSGARLVLPRAAGRIEVDVEVDHPRFRGLLERLLG